jgi:hypothetical protein
VIGAGGRQYGAIAGDDPTFEQHQFARRVCFDPRTPLDGIVKRVATVLTAALTRSKTVSIRVVAAEIGLSHVPRASRMARVQGPAG